MTSNKVSLILWRNKKDTDMWLLLYDYQFPFIDSSYNQDWKRFLKFDAINPIIRPFPLGTELFNALHSLNFPNQLITIYPLSMNSLDINETGTYFVAWTSSFPGKVKLPTDLFIQHEHINKVNIYVENLFYFK